MRLFRPYPRITLASAGDAPALADLYSRAWSAGLGVPDELVTELSPAPGEVESWFRGGFEIYRAFHEGRLAGVVRVSFPTGAAMLDRLAVDPGCRRRGIGRALLERGVDRGRKAGVTRAWVQLSPLLTGAAALHRSLGFREVHRRAGPGGEMVLLELVL
jgi:ribosomal-protein-alanine N-acetyltransferase